MGNKIFFIIIGIIALAILILFGISIFGSKNGSKSIATEQNMIEDERSTRVENIPEEYIRRKPLVPLELQTHEASPLEPEPLEAPKELAERSEQELKLIQEQAIKAQEGKINNDSLAREIERIRKAKQNFRQNP